MRQSVLDFIISYKVGNSERNCLGLGLLETRTVTFDSMEERMTMECDLPEIQVILANDTIWTTRHEGIGNVISLCIIIFIPGSCSAGFEAEM